MPNCESQVIYAAGFFDGEGHVAIRKSYPRGVMSYSMRMTVAQIDPRPLHLLMELWGGSLRLETMHKPRPIWRWNLQARQAKIALEEMLPYLIVKEKQAKIAIRFQARRVVKSTKRSVRLDAEWENEFDLIDIANAKV